jgi:hypothetical protein
MRGRLAALLMALVLLGVTAGAAGAAAITFTDEGYSTFEHQLAAGEIASVTINKRLASLRITLKNGEHVLAHYEKHGEPAAAAALMAKKVPVTVLTPAEAVKEIPKKAVHHKIRYIVGAAVIVVLIIVVAVLLVTRRRRAAADY